MKEDNFYDEATKAMDVAELKKDAKFFWQNLGLAIPWIVPSILYKGWALTKLWKWFVVPIFNVEPLSIASAWGLVLITSFLPPMGDTSKTDDNRILDPWKGARGFSKLAIVVSGELLIGWIITFFM